MGIRISKDHLHPSVIESITSLIGDLSQLETTAKGNAVEAINELLANSGNKEELEALMAEIAEGKELIANAVGEPLTAEESFDEMSNDINSLLSTFKTNMMNNGITVESNDRFKSLIDKIATLADNEGKGIQYAEGIINPYNNNGVYSVDIELNFNPTIIIIETDYICAKWTGYEEMGSIITYYNKVSSEDTYFVGSTSNESDSSYLYEMNTMVNSGNKWTFDFNIVANDSNFLYTFTNKKYYAIGVGEEDTTLRDSLASILTEEGVSVTEEDDMASLITKVDEEFNDKENEAENTRSTLAGLMQEGGYDITGDEDINSLLELLVLSGISVSEIKQIACGYNHTFILKNDGSVWSCGYNAHGQLGLGDTTDRYTFTQVTTNINNDVEQIACGGGHTFILKNDGSIWSCGLNGNHQLGLNSTTTTTYKSFTQVTTNINNDVNQIACGQYHTFIIKNDGSLWSCGYNSFGQLGLNDITQRTTFTMIPRGLY